VEWLSVPGAAVNARSCRRIAAGLLATVAVCAQAFGDEAAQSVTRILDYRNGYIVTDGGNIVRVAPSVQIIDFDNKPSLETPGPGMYAQLTIANGEVQTIAISISAPKAKPTAPPQEYEPVIFVALVPPSTQLTDQVYMATSETSWSPTAVRMDRIDARHFRAIVRVPLQGIFKYLYTRGNLTSLERGNNGLQRKARTLQVEAGQEPTVHDAIAHWGDEAGNGLLAPPQTFPTPYNPAPYPNLPSPATR
jgi:hypothetical protein